MWVLPGSTHFMAGKVVFLRGLLSPIRMSPKDPLCLGGMHDRSSDAQYSCLPFSALWKFEKRVSAQFIHGTEILLIWDFLCDEILNNHLIDINKTTGALILAHEPDAEVTTFMTFKATCSIENVTFTMMGSVNILDINDNAPTTQLGNTTAYMKLGVKTVSRLYD
ncbi:hypothetical protein TNCV_2891571 [Trichonephila clavipes]|nr:hypothetical protein TNCV_2891571 [Trichonephila clavipes]